MRIAGRFASVVSFCLAVTAGLLAPPSFGYTPGSGTIYSDDFEGVLDEGWEQGNGFPGAGNTSPWTQTADGADNSFKADGRGPFPGSPTLHWARHVNHPVRLASYSIAFEYRAELGPGYTFDLETEQRALTLRKLRLRIDGNGALSLWRTENGAFVQVASTAASTIPINQKRWIRWSFEPDGSGHHWLRVRVWSGSATSEPISGWTLEFLDDMDTIDRAHRFELIADGPANVDTFIDDLDVWGDGSAGVDSSIKTVYVVELAHLDIGFTEPPPEIELFAKTHLDQVLGNVAADPNYRWTIEEGWWLDRWWEQSSPSEHQEMVTRLQQGRIRLTAGYASLHTTTAGHEQLTRNVYWSRKFAREHGVPVRVWITDDVPGSSYAIPEILARSNIDYFVGGHNTGFGGAVNHPSMGEQPFWWVAPDGSKTLSWNTYESYAEGFQWGFSFFDNLAAMYDKTAVKMPEREEVGYPFPELMILRGFDNHYQNFHVRNLINQWNSTYSTPVFQLTTVEEFLDMMLAKYGPEAFPEFSGDFGAAWAPSRGGAPYTQQAIREAHREARAAEALSAMSSALDGQDPPTAQFEFLYRKMLESDEHSGAGGWPGYYTPAEMQSNNETHLGYATDALDSATQLVSDELTRFTADLSSSGDALAAINTLGHVRDGWVRAELDPALFNSDFQLIERASQTEIAYQKFAATSEIIFLASAVPAMGYKTYDLVAGLPGATTTGQLDVTATSLENDHYLLQIDPTDGALLSVFHKPSARELIDLNSAYKFNQLASNTKAEYDFQNPPVADPPTSATTSIAASGPLVAEVLVQRTGSPLYETVYRLYLNEDRVEIENRLDRDLAPYVPRAIATRAYTVTLPFDVHDFELRTETTTRFLDPVGDSFDRASLFDWHNTEHSMAFWDTNGGVRYAVDSVTAHHIENLSSLTSPAYSTGDALILPRMYDRVDEYEFDDETIGPFEIEPGAPRKLTYTHHIQATPASFDPVATSRFGFASLNPLKAQLVSKGPGNLPPASASGVQVDRDEVLVYTLKPASVGDGMVVRLTEMTGQTIPARLSSSLFSVLNAEHLEQDEEGGTPLTFDASGVDITLAPYETATVRLVVDTLWEPITLTVNKDEQTGEVLLQWTDGTAPFTLQRAEDPQFTAGFTLLVDEQPVNNHDDPDLSDGLTHFYLVR